MNVAAQETPTPLVFQDMDVFWKSTPEAKEAAWQLVKCELCGRQATMFYPEYLNGQTNGPFEVTRARCDFHYRRHDHGNTTAQES